MNKGYPRTRFELIDQTTVQEINTNSLSGNSMPLAMATYTSDKGPEDWRVYLTFNDFYKATGSISYVKHGQPQLTVCELLRNGAAVFCKRLVSDDATLANVTVWARVVRYRIKDAVEAQEAQPAVTEGPFQHDAIPAVEAEPAQYITLVYYFTKSVVDAKTFDDVYENVYNTSEEDIAARLESVLADEKVEEEGTTEIPLFSVAAKGRGVSNLRFQIVPIYTKSKTANYLRYSFNVHEGDELLESTTFTMNPDVVIDNVSQGLNPKIKANSTQVDVQMYDDGLLAFVRLLSETATSDGEQMSYRDIVNCDFINGIDYRGRSTIGGIVTYKQAVSSTTATAADIALGYNLWDDFKPTNNNAINICSEIGIPLPNGSYGALGDTPIGKDYTKTYVYPTEYVKLVTEAYGGNIDYNADEYDVKRILEGGEDSPDQDWPVQFNPIIYDLDAYKVDFICDCAYPTSVKNTIINLMDARQDAIFFADLGLTVNNTAAILKAAEAINDSRFVAVYHNYFKIYNEYDHKQVTVTLPLLLGIRLISHIANGVARPFAGQLNGITFPEIIAKSINFVPVTIPGWDQKQMLVDQNINYITLYDEVPVLETMYVNHAEYTQLSYLHNIMGIQEIVKQIRTRCPKVRYTFMDGEDLKRYIDECNNVLNQYASFFDTLEMEYMADEAYENNNIFYATIRVKFKNFIQEEFFRVIAIS